MCQCGEGCQCGENCQCSGACKAKMRHGHRGGHASGGAVYGLGMIGAAVYFIGHAAGFWLGVLGLLKAIVWPAFLVYYAMRSLGM